MPNQLYHGDNKLNSIIRWWCTLCTRPTVLNWIFIMLVHWNNSLPLDMSLHSDTLSQFHVNQSLLLLLNATKLYRGEATNTHFIVFCLTSSGLEPTIYHTNAVVIFRMHMFKKWYIYIETLIIRLNIDRKLTVHIYFHLFWHLSDKLQALTQRKIVWQTLTPQLNVNDMVNCVWIHQLILPAHNFLDMPTKENSTLWKSIKHYKYIFGQ